MLGAITWLWTTIEAITRRRVLVVDFDETSNPWMRWWRLLLPDGREPAVDDELLTAAWTVALIALAVGGWAWATRRDLKIGVASRIHKEAPVGNIADIVGATGGATEVRPIGFWPCLLDRRPHLSRQRPADEIGDEPKTLQHRAGFHCSRGGQQFLRIDLAKSAVHDAGELGRTAGEFRSV